MPESAQRAPRTRPQRNAGELPAAAAIPGSCAIPLAVELRCTRLGRALGAQLVGVTAYDPPTLAAAAVLLTVTVAIASWIPARRAARVDPMVALRNE
jgi:hypothetical protein